MKESTVRALLGDDAIIALVPSPSFVVVQQLAKGGMGSVELVMRHEGAFRRLYALKRPHPTLVEDELYRTMLLEEARVAGLLRHPNIVSVLDIGEDEGGPYLLMDFVDGLPVSAIIRRSDDLLPLDFCLQVVVQAAEGLDAAHTLRSVDGKLLGVVHRDVSPQNVLVGFDGVARIADFGIAKVLDSRTPATGQVLKGKLGYMSPEQLRFEAPDARSDLFALGVVLFEMLTRRRLHGRGAPEEVAQRVMNMPVPDILEIRSDVPPGVVELLFDLLAKDRESRPESAAEVAGRARALLAETQSERTLKEWMHELYDEQRGEREKARREAIRAAEHVITGSHRSHSPVPVPTSMPSRDLAPSQQRLASKRIAAGALLLVGLAAAAVMWLSVDRPTAAAPTTATVEPLQTTTLEPSPQPVQLPTEPEAQLPEVEEPEAEVEAGTAEAEPVRHGTSSTRSTTAMRPSTAMRSTSMSAMRATPDIESSDMTSLWGWNGQ